MNDLARRWCGGPTEAAPPGPAALGRPGPPPSDGKSSSASTKAEAAAAAAAVDAEGLWLESASADLREVVLPEFDEGAEGGCETEPPLPLPAPNCGSEEIRLRSLRLGASAAAAAAAATAAAEGGMPCEEETEPGLEETGDDEAEESGAPGTLSTSNSPSAAPFNFEASPCCCCCCSPCCCCSEPIDWEAPLPPRGAAAFSSNGRLFPAAASCSRPLEGRAVSGRSRDFDDHPDITLEPG